MGLLLLRVHFPVDSEFEVLTSVQQRAHKGPDTVPRVGVWHAGYGVAKLLHRLRAVCVPIWLGEERSEVGRISGGERQDHEQEGKAEQACWACQRASEAQFGQLCIHACVRARTGQFDCVDLTLRTPR